MVDGGHDAMTALLVDGQHMIDQIVETVEDGDLMHGGVVPLVAVDQSGAHAGVERADHVGFRLVADVKRMCGIDAQRDRARLRRSGCAVFHIRSTPR